MNNHTLGGIFERSGVGLHSGILTKVRVLPAAAGEGRYFVRVDLPELPIIPARVDAVSQTRLSTELRTSTMREPTGLDASVRTVEHLLAALAGSGVDDARIEIDGSEVPLLDGSALVWVEAILEAGVVAQDGVFVRGRGRGGEGERGREGEGERGREGEGKFLNSGPRTGNKPSQGHPLTPSQGHPLPFCLKGACLGVSRGCFCDCYASTHNPIYLWD